MLHSEQALKIGGIIIRTNDCQVQMVVTQHPLGNAQHIVTRYGFNLGNNLFDGNNAPIAQLMRPVARRNCPGILQGKKNAPFDLLLMQESR